MVDSLISLTLYHYLLGGKTQALLRGPHIWIQRSSLLSVNFSTVPLYVYFFILDLSTF